MDKMEEEWEKGIKERNYNVSVCGSSVAYQTGKYKKHFHLGC